MLRNTIKGRGKTPSATQILGLLGKAPEIMDQYKISPDKNGALKAMEMAGLSMSDLKKYIGMVNLPIIKNIADSVANKSGTSVKEFTDWLNGFISENEGNKIGNRAERRASAKIKTNNNRMNWRNF